MNSAPPREYVFYAIEEDVETGSDGAPAYDLVRRMDEHGEGSPLLFADRGTAEALIKEASEATGCYGYQRVVELQVTARFPEPFFCVRHGVWGLLADHMSCED